MSCPYTDKCSDEDIKCATCMHSEKRSHYVEYHEYPDDKELGTDLRFPTGDNIAVPQPSGATGSDFRFPIDRLHVLRNTWGDTGTPTTWGPKT